jgi:hypothetical protein
MKRRKNRHSRIAAVIGECFAVAAALVLILGVPALLGCVCALVGCP